MLCYLLLATVCLTWLTVWADQVSTAATMKKIAELDELIDETFNPCDDFQKYVCSRKKERFDTQLQLKINQRLTNRVNTGLRPSDQEAVKKFYDFYGKCTTVFDQRNNTLQRLLQDLDNEFKDGSGKYLPFDAKLVAKLSAFLNVNHGISFFTRCSFNKPIAKSSRWYSKTTKLLYFNEYDFFISRSFYDPRVFPYLRDQLIAAFQQRVAAAFPTKSASEVNEMTSTFFKFEEELSKLLPYPKETEWEKAKLLQEVTVGEAMTRYPGMDWKTYITTLSDYSGVDLLNGSRLENYPLAMDSPKIVTALPRIVKMLSEDTLREYIRFRVIDNFNSVFNNNSVPGSCQTTSFALFSLVQQYFYITETLPTPEDRVEFKKSLGKLADDIVGSAIDMLEGISWIKNDNQTFAGFTDKINKLTKVIGYPDELANQTWLDEHYKSFILDDADDLYSLYLKTNKHVCQNILKADKLSRSVIEVNAFSIPSADKFQINIGLVDDILYHPDYVPALNYGALGAMIGHEVLHDFDIDGCEYDGDGYINPWMSAESKAKFHSMAQCVIDAYDKLNTTDSTGKVTRINGTMTLAENMSDNGGIRAAYMAFKKNPAHTQSFPKTKKLEKYSQEQLFFLAFARMWCGPPFEFHQFLSDDHSPGEIRILGTLQNFVPFREAFNCPANSVYAPEKHCEVYTPDLGSGVSALIPNFILLVMALVIS